MMDLDEKDSIQRIIKSIKIDLQDNKPVPAYFKLEDLEKRLIESFGIKES